VTGTTSSSLAEVAVAKVANARDDLVAVLDVRLDLRRDHLKECGGDFFKVGGRDA
jgi:hypothetical protein